MTAVELMGPAEVFSRPASATDNGREDRYYQVVTIGTSAAPCMTASGVVVKPDVDMQRAPQLDTVIVPGGRGIQSPKVNKQIADWLNSRASVLRRIAAVGSGIYAIAPTGLLDGRQVVTHWRFAKDVASRFPKLRVNSHNLFVKDGAFYTCAGGASTVDFALSLIEEDYGRQVALGLARELIVHLKRPGEEEQYSEPLQFQIQSSDRFADLPAWILCHLKCDLTVDGLAERVGMSRRNFTRLFSKTFGRSPSQFVAQARIAEAKERLLVPRNSVESVANSLGFRSADVFSVAFERHMGIRPGTYRALRKASAINALAKARTRRSVHNRRIARAA
jgi:transcriptional regulator GlxA family with amidase domain